LGLAFKPDIDDLRESPALSIAQKIGSISFSSIFLVEPNIDRIPSGFNSDNTELIGLERAIKSADIIVLLVDHTSFKSMDLSLLSGKQVIDTRGIWS
jgi:UDP-N-acetyl-D-mannosaminuronic acid dehydrogenase